MTSSSDGDYSEMEINDNGEWRKVYNKRKRDKNPNSPTQQHPKKQAFPSVRNMESTQVAYQNYQADNYQTTGNSNDVIHVHPQSTQNINTARVNKITCSDKEEYGPFKGFPPNASANQNTKETKTTTQTINKHKPNIIINQNINLKEQHKNNNLTKTTNVNFSLKMKGIQNTEYANLYYIMVNSEEVKDRIQMADLWNTKNSTNTDVILKTKLGYLLKSNNNKEKLKEILEDLQNHNKILSYQETKQRILQKEKVEPKQTYSVVISGMEKNISDEELSKFLQDNGLDHRYCRRIISRQFHTPTGYIRVITGYVRTFEELLNNGLFYKNRHYPVYPSNPPEPTPIPCNICLKFDHTTEKCSNTPLCTKCQGPHKTSMCKSKEPPKCSSCGDENHQAWSLKCPRHPKKPIEGIPNVNIKPLNKKSKDIEESSKKQKRIHSSVTIHDIIINTYIRKLNKPKNINREELLQKLKRRFINEYNVDTTAVFSGNRIYILMFDIEDPEADSPTEPVHNQNNRQIQL